MSDQAQSLRNLVRRTGLWGRTGRHTVSLVSVCGARPGIGASTLSALIAGGLRRQGRRVTLVESHCSPRQVADRCQLQIAGSLDDVLNGRRTVRETLMQGPAGVAILPRRRAGDPPQKTEDHQVEDTLQALARLGTQTDVVLIDAGVCPNPACQPWWREADLTLLVTTPEPIAVMDGYAGLKQAASHRTLPPLWTIVNQYLSPELVAAKKIIDPAEVPGRIARACRRFLNADLLHSFLIPYDHDVEQHAWHFTPPQPDDGEFFAAIEALVSQLATWLDAEKAQRAA